MIIFEGNMKTAIDTIFYFMYGVPIHDENMEVLEWCMKIKNVKKLIRKNR